MNHATILAAAGLTQADLTGGTLPVRSPIYVAEITRVPEPKAAELTSAKTQTQSTHSTLSGVITQS